ncbi:hypothetical protein OIE63_39725 (plasmid) [Streptomyces sp. NBC_01795]|uniref:hypothetical protein n=1 Tax=unclassified Streptomyces TaxID=2593676 RepID=UPI002DD8E56B|nr:MULTISPECIES: hypothetical protein [unclassified Streptomyces]WSA97643.1 hypothetical protein OIE63_39725 [Streptomyces sp. NBC_01795]WSB82107.1 hypothetical protein OHB04_41090 [Streptomyces sp. NBC_01775]WSS18078.1 hypothetical protein OG533_40170 [Streptomyces sp. NBC_01186]
MDPETGLDGRRTALNAVVLSNSEGLDRGQVDVQLEASRIGKSWYVTGLGLSAG